MPARDGLYQVSYHGICAGFIVEGGKVTAIAPVLRKRFAWWWKRAKYLGP